MPLPETMQAILVQRLGSPEVLELTRLPKPEPRAGQVRLRVRAVGLNFADILNVAGEYLTRARVPFVPGMEFAGEIDAFGEGVTGLHPGQLVAALGAGGLAEYAVVPAGAVLPVSPNLSPQEAAALPVSYYTAFFALRTLGRAQAGESVLVEAASGALGTATVQLAKAMGLRVIATSGSAAKLGLASQLGADHAFVTDEHLRARVLEVTDNKGVDLYSSVVGGHGFEDRVTTMVAARGRVLVIGNASREAANLNPTMLLRKNLSVIGVWLTPFLQDAAAVGEASAFLGPLLASGQVKPVVGRSFALAQAREAFEFMAARQSTGKVVIEP